MLIVRLCYKLDVQRRNTKVSTARIGHAGLRTKDKLPQTVQDKATKPYVSGGEPSWALASTPYGIAVSSTQMSGCFVGFNPMNCVAPSSRSARAIPAVAASMRARGVARRARRAANARSILVAREIGRAESSTRISGVSRKVWRVRSTSTRRTDGGGGGDVMSKGDDDGEKVDEVGEVGGDSGRVSGVTMIGYGIIS
jgi:hypothetical protein